MSRLAHFFLIGLVFLGAAFATGALVQPVAGAPGRATVTVFREKDGWFKNPPVDISINGRKVTKLAESARYTTSVPAGEVTLTTSHWSDLGRYSVKFKAQPGRRYKFQVSLREEAVGAALLLGFSGMVLDTIVNENSGSYKITPVK